jgi:hypothetical protein
MPAAMYVRSGVMASTEFPYFLSQNQILTTCRSKYRKEGEIFLEQEGHAGCHVRPGCAPASTKSPYFLPQNQILAMCRSIRQKEQQMFL